MYILTVSKLMCHSIPPGRPMTISKTNYKDIHHLCILEDDNFIVGGKDDVGYKLTKYDTETGSEIISTPLKNELQGMTCICLEGKPSLGLSYR